MKNTYNYTHTTRQCTTQEDDVVQHWNMNGTMELQNQTKTGNNNNGNNNNNNYKHFDKFKTIKRKTLKIHNFFLLFYFYKQTTIRRETISIFFFLLFSLHCQKILMALTLVTFSLGTSVWSHGESPHWKQREKKKTLCSTEKKLIISTVIFLVCFFFFCVLINLLSFGGSKTNSLETHSTAIPYDVRAQYSLLVNISKGYIHEWLSGFKRVKIKRIDGNNDNLIHKLWLITFHFDFMKASKYRKTFTKPWIFSQIKYPLCKMWMAEFVFPFHHLQREPVRISIFFFVYSKI